MTKFIKRSHGATGITFIGMLVGPRVQARAIIRRLISTHADRGCDSCLHSNCKAHRDPCETCLMASRHGDHKYWTPQLPRIFGETEEENS